MIRNDNTQKTLKYVNEKQLLIFERAFKHVNTEKLCAEFMICFAEFNEYDIIFAKWNEILYTFKSSAKIWKGYIDFRQSSSVSFTVNSTVECYEEAIQRLANDTKGLLERENDVLHLFIRSCYMLYQSGYTERAFASFQAMIEITCFKPVNLSNHSFIDLLDELEQFWDGDEPRFGETGGKGWCNTNTSSLSKTIFNLKTEGNVQVEDIGDPYKSWYFRELQLQFGSWLPQRDDVDLNDPFRTVLFDDVRGTLFEIKSMGAKQNLIRAMMKFLGCSIEMGASRKGSDVFLDDTFAHPLMSEIFLKPSNASGSTNLEFPIDNYPRAISSESANWPSKYTHEAMNVISMRGAHQIEILQNILTLVSAEESLFLPNDLVSSQLLWLKSVTDPENSEKHARKLLKVDPTNLGLWSTFAQILIKGGKHQQAKQVFETAISMLPEMPKKVQEESFILFTAFADCLFIMGDLEKCKAILAAYMQVPDISLALESYRGLIDETIQFLPYQMYNLRMEKVLMTIQNFALLSFLEFDLAKVSEIYDTIISGIPRRCTLFEELLYAQYLRLVYYNAITSHNFRPVVIRSILEMALKSYPENALFLALYAWSEARTKLENRTRRFINEHALR